MFGIIYTLVMGCIYGIGGIKDRADDQICKEKYYNPRTGTYIDSRGCTRDYKTNEPRIVTSQWNKEKKRYEQIVLRNGTQIVKNVTEEEDKLRKDIQIKKQNKETQHYPSLEEWLLELKKKKEPRLQWQIDEEKRLLEVERRKKESERQRKEEMERLRRLLNR